MENKSHNKGDGVRGGAKTIRAKVSQKVLELISEGPALAIDILAAFLEAGYGASRGKMEYALDRRQDARAERQRERAEEMRLRQRYYTLVSRLKKDGLIAKEGNMKDKKLCITSQGLKKLKLLKSSEDSQFPEISRHKKEGGEKLVIVVFDIPERERRKRDWLRAALRHLEMRMIQKSVWVGKVKIPRSFLDDIAALRLVEFVEIFEVGKRGSLSHLI
ncbi:MAG: CRISPR-associated endonuclease Cas2 [Patescibacteria group bacterium]|nr:CRISPR-associated endonuclease Cas2 [Patescibacteria group bacterium]